MKKKKEYFDSPIRSKIDEKSQLITKFINLSKCLINWSKINL